MADSTTVTVRLDRTVRDRLEAVAKSQRRSKSFLAAEAIEEYVAVQEWQIGAIGAGLAALDRGEGVPHDQVKAWVASWGGAEEIPKPSAARRRKPRA